MIQATQLAAATPVPVNRNTRTLPVNILRTYFPAATGIDKNIKTVNVDDIFKIIGQVNKNECKNGCKEGRIKIVTFILRAQF